jgi:hypothetical protein
MKKLLLLPTLILLFVSFAALNSCTSSGKASGAKMLRFNLEKGKGYDYEIIWDMGTQMMGQETRINVGGYYSMNVKEDDGKVRTIDMEYKRLRMDMNVMGTSISMDSDNSSVDDSDSANMLTAIMNKVFAGIMNKPFVMKVDEQGNVIEVEGFDKIVNAMVDSLNVDPEVKEQAQASMKDQFSDSDIKDQFVQVFSIFPNKEIKVGDKWEKSYSTSGRQAANYKTVYTAKEIDGDYVTLVADTKIDSYEDGVTKVTGKQKGNVIVDSRTGLVVNAEFDQDLEIAAGGMKISLTGKGKIKGTAR